MKIPKSLFIFAPVAGVVMGICLFLSLTGTVSLSMNGFAVDREDRLYIGFYREITVWENGVQVRSISPKTSRGYSFTIQNGDTLIVDAAEDVYYMDLQGNILEKKEDAHYRIPYNRVFVSERGEAYTVKYPFGRMQICKNDEMIYQMPMLDYAVLLVFIILWNVTFVYVGIIAFKYSPVFQNVRHKKTGDVPADK